MAIQWRIELLGGLRAEQGERVLSRFRTQKAGLLLAYLALTHSVGTRRQRSHRREALIELLWPEMAPQEGRTALRTSLYSLRLQLEPPGVLPGAVLVADRTSVGLNPAAVTTDVAEFDAACGAGLPPGAAPPAGAGRSEEQAQRLARAVELYRGELLPGFFDDWILQERQWLAERYFEALAQLLAHLERSSEFERALDYARRGVSADPLREEAHRDLIRLLAAVGQPSAALRQYQELARLLKEQLDASPEPATRALVREIERLSVLRSQPSAAPLIASPPQPVTTLPEGENRLVTLLFADMSRSLETTRDLHPEDAAALVNRLLQAMVDVILKYEGHIDRFQGDGALAVFGVPHAHEDDPERAIQAALEIREAAHHLDLEVTAGINTGEVYAGAVGSERHQETTVMGPAVGLAARLQEQARPGQVLVGELTQRLARRAFEFTACSLGLKGLARPTTVYVVEQALARPEKARGIEGLRAELIGRDEELAKLKGALTHVHQGQGQVVTLIGEAGVGKSRLVAELKRHFGFWILDFGLPAEMDEPDLPVPSSLSDQSKIQTPRGHPKSKILWLEGRCLELTMTASYSLFVDLFRDYFARRPAEEDDRTRSERLVACLRMLGEQGELSEERIEEIGPLLGNLLSLRFGTDWDRQFDNVSPEQIRHQTFLAVRDFFVALARRRPLVLVLEDLHWADSLSLDLISLLLEALPLAPLLLLCVYRPERGHKCWHLGTIAARKCPDCCTEIALRELTPPQSRRLVEALLTVENLPATVKELILERSRGNPFFVEEVLRSFMAAGMIYREGDIWRAREEIAMVSVPESIQSVIASRVDRLPPELQQVLQSAAVMGRLFRRRLLEAVLPEPGTREAGGELDRALWALEDAALIYQERAVPEVEYSFQHVLTQETIYQSLLRRQRPLLHQQVGEAIEGLYPGELDEHVEQLAYHYERSQADEKAVEYLLKAGEKAKRAYLNEDAIGYFQRVLERLDRETGGQGAGAKQQEPSSRPVSPSPPPAGRVPGPVAERSAQRLEALRGLGQVQLGIGKAAEAEEQFRQAVALGQASTHQGGGGLAPRELARLYYWLCDAVGLQGKRDQVLSLGQEGLALVRNDPESVEATLMSHVVGIGYLQTGEGVKGWELIRQSARFLEHLPYTEELRSVYFWIVQMYANEDETVGEATRWLQIFERKAQLHHDLRAQGDALNLWADRLGMGRGDLRGAIPLYAKALEFYGKIGGIKHESACLAALGGLCLSLGRLREAEEYAQRGRVVEQALERGWMMAGFFTVMGKVSLCQGDWRQAEAAFQEAAQRFRTGPIWWSNNTASHALGRAYLAGGRRADARQQFQGALALAGTDDDGQFADLLSGLEETDGPPEEFRAFCHRLREGQPEARDSRFVQWYLEPAEVDSGFSIRNFGLPTSEHEIGHSESRIQNAGARGAGGWAWHDPFADGALRVQDGLEIRAANGRDLRRLNGSAPRLLRPAGGGDFAVQTVCCAESEHTPAIGGILLWGSKENYLRLERGTRGPHEVSFQGRLDDPASLLYPDDVIIGRGRLPAERLFLRLERHGSQVRALCSADGQNWFTVGHVEFPVGDPVEIGLHAIGNINRLIYPGAYPEGTAIRFGTFDLWTTRE